MTTLYFVRHAKVVYTEDDHSRALSPQGQADVHKVTEAFKNIPVDIIASSPFVRAVNTIQGISDIKNIPIDLHYDLRERKVAHNFIDDFHTFVDNQWQDFDYHLDGGESLNQVQSRGVKALEKILDTHANKSIVVGTHGTFQAVIMNYYDKKYDLDFWRTIQMPDIYKLEFDDLKLCSVKKIEM